MKHDSSPFFFLTAGWNFSHPFPSRCRGLHRSQAFLQSFSILLQASSVAVGTSRSSRDDSGWWLRKLGLGMKILEAWVQDETCCFTVRGRGNIQTCRCSWHRLILLISSPAFTSGSCNFHSRFDERFTQLMLSHWSLEHHTWLTALLLTLYGIKWQVRGSQIVLILFFPVGWSLAPTHYKGAGRTIPQFVSWFLQSQLFV